MMSPSKPSASNSGTALRNLSDDLASAVERASQSLVAIHARPRIAASGVYWREGIIVATSHTIRREQDIRITLPDGSGARATVAGRDGGTDLAVLKLDPPSATSLAVPGRADVESVRVGTLVLAVGRPGEDGVSASLGVVSSVGGRWRTWSGGEIDRFVRLDLAIYDGFSGGALVDAQGNVAGINSSALARGTPLTIPIPTVDRIVDTLIARGHVARAYLGIAMQPVRLTPAMARRHGLGDAADNDSGAQGVLVVHVEGDSPAERAGLLIGDVIVSADRRAIGEPQDMAELLGSDRVGQQLALGIVRGGARKALDVTIGDRPVERAGRGRGES